MHIAIISAGIAGNSAARVLCDRHGLRTQMFSRAREIERHFPSVSICNGRNFFVLMSDWFGGNEGFPWLRTLSFSTAGFEVRIFSSCLAILWFAHKYR